MRINGIVAGESGLGALVAQNYGVPVVLITGDQFVGPEIEPFCPGIEAVEVKRSISRTAAGSLHPAKACAAIRAGAERALRRLAEIGPPRIELPATLEIEFRTEDMADAVAGFERIGDRTVRTTDADPLRLFRAFLAANAATRPLSQVR